MHALFQCCGSLAIWWWLVNAERRAAAGLPSVSTILERCSCVRPIYGASGRVMRVDNRAVLERLHSRRVCNSRGVRDPFGAKTTNCGFWNRVCAREPKNGSVLGAARGSPAPGATGWLAQQRLPAFTVRHFPSSNVGHTRDRKTMAGSSTANKLAVAPARSVLTAGLSPPPLTRAHVSRSAAIARILDACLSPTIRQARSELSGQRPGLQRIVRPAA